MRVYESDARRILSCVTKSERLLAFMLTVIIDAYGACDMSHAQLRDAIGVKSSATIETAVRGLVGRGVFAKRSGMIFFAGDTKKYVTNRYIFPPDYRRNGRFIVVGKLTHENIYDCYLHALHELCGGDIGLLTAREIKDMKNLERRNAHGTWEEDEDG